MQFFHRTGAELRRYLARIHPLDDGVDAQAARTLAAVSEPQTQQLDRLLRAHQDGQLVLQLPLHVRKNTVALAVTYAELGAKAGRRRRRGPDATVQFIAQIDQLP